MSIGADGRCTLPSTHIRGGGYVEVECYCEAHALDAAKKYGDTELPRVLDPNHGCLDTTVGLVRNRRPASCRVGLLCPRGGGQNGPETRKQRRKPGGHAPSPPGRG
jgi:hypothetical protein